MVEEGTHEELLFQKGGVYSGLVKRQLDLGDNKGGGSNGDELESPDLGHSRTRNTTGTRGPSRVAKTGSNRNKALMKEGMVPYTHPTTGSSESSSEAEGESGNHLRS